MLCRPPEEHIVSPNLTHEAHSNRLVLNPGFRRRIPVEFRLVDGFRIPVSAGGVRGDCIVLFVI